MKTAAQRSKEWRKNNPEKVKAYYERSEGRRKKYYEDNKEEIMKKWDKYYAKNKVRIQANKKKQRQANGYKEEKTEARKKAAYIRHRTANKYPLKGQKCEECPNNAEHRHHITVPTKIDEFIFLCEACHDEIHGRNNYRKNTAGSSGEAKK